MYNNEEEIARIFLLKVLPNFQKRGLDRTLIFKGRVGMKEGVTYLRGGGLQFLKAK